MRQDRCLRGGVSFNKGIGRAGLLPPKPFGEYDVSEGGGASPLLVVPQSDGKVFGVDIERDDDPLFVVNSSLQAFIDTFCLLDKFVGRGSANPC